ncbi:hypothetical protein PPYR_09300 [Photinus pyralis]|uniref:Essential protein Yae1 N-terminal domain-containing protein n=1 Tax=Photinus pyralis TaxID=7054 RepID=A0A1Y1KI25_PHOPY|nr:protein yae1 [Photinus pyralis]KAB0798307.1 hypothetical protein PPYR_09300 [Photinus pyralis]
MALDETEISQSWNKFANVAKLAGYREGVSDGKEQVFQKSFDEGYQDGFQIGFNLGKYKGAINGTSVGGDESLTETRKGLCIICKDSNLLEGSIQEVKHVQAQISNNVLDELQKKCVNITQPQP